MTYASPRISGQAVRRFARLAVKVALLPAGVVGWRRAGDLVILLYHRVGTGDREIDVGVDDLERQLSILTRDDCVRSLDDVIAGGVSGGVVVTFDDGFRDFHECVLPLLVRHRIPAVLYLATGFVADGAECLGRRSDALSWSQLREAVSTGWVTVASHTHSHADLSRVNEAEAETEMRTSKELIEDKLEVSCDHFAYPWAVASADAEKAARRMFRSAALNAWKTNRRGRTDPHRLGRVPILRNDGSFFFKAKAKGMLDSEAWAYQVLRRGPWGRA